MRKYADTQKVEVVKPQEAQRIASNLHSIGKTSAAHLSDEERKRTLDTRNPK